MNVPSFRKYNHFIFYPDLGYKFLLPTVRHIILPKHFKIYLKYIFSNQRTYSFIAIKALLMINSIYPTRCHYTSRIITLKYSKTRCHSIVFLPLTLHELSLFFTYYMMKPVSINTAMNSFIKESRYFIFPGFIKHLRLPSWQHTVNLSFKHLSRIHLYTFFFYKTAYLD